MLISLRQTLHADLSVAVSSISQTVQGHEQHVTHIEAKMEELISVHNLIDAHTNHDNELQELRLKLADLEDWSCWNNIKFRNIHKNLPQTELT